MNEPETEMTEQPLTEPAVQTDPAAAPAALAPQPLAPPAVPAEEPRVDNNVPLPMVQPAPGREPAWTSHDFEMAASGIRTEPQPEPAAEPQPAPAPAAAPAAAQLRPLTVPEPVAAAEDKPEQATAAEEEKERRAAREAYWKTALTGDPDSIPDSFRARAASADLTSSAGETEYDLLNAVNRSWYADHSELSRERIAAEWPRIRAELTEQYGVGDSERELFTALSLAPEEEARREAARKVYDEGFRGGLLGKEEEKRAPWTEEADPWTALRKQARQEGEQHRRELMPAAQQLSKAFRVYHSAETALGMGLLAESINGDTPDWGSLCRSLVQMDEQSRQTLYDLTLHEMEQRGEIPAASDWILSDLRRSLNRGILNVDLGLVQFAGNLSAAAANLVADAGLSDKAGEVARTTDEYLRVLEELRIVAQERVNPIHREGESTARMLALDVAEATPAAIVSMVSAPGMVLASASGVGSGLAEVRSRQAAGDISMQTAAGLVAFGAQMGASQIMNRVGGSLFEKTMSRFVRDRLPGATGSFTLKALSGSGRFGTELLGNALDNRVGRGIDLLAQEGAARLEGVASNIDWAEYGKEWGDVELNIRDAARSLPYILIGSGRASLHHFRDPRALVADGATLSEWGVPEETQRRLMNSDNLGQQNRLLYEALHNGTRWGGAGFLQEAGRALRLLHTDDFQPFRDPDVVRDFLQLPAESEAERARVLTMGSSADPAYFTELARKHSGGTWIRNRKKGMPFLMMTEAWTQRAFPEDIPGYPTLQELAPPELSKLGDFRPETEKARREAVNKTVRYLDALSYRLLLDSTSYNTLTFEGRPPAEVGKEMDDVRHHIIAKVAESVLVRARGAKQDVADQVFGQAITDYYGRMRYSSSADSWIRFVPLKYMSNYHVRALSPRARHRGLEMRKTRYPEMLRSYWTVQGMRNCVMALADLLPYQEDFRTALSRGMTPQEAYAHLLHRELGSRLPQADWFPRDMAEDVTDRSAVLAENRAMTEFYTRLTGNALESHETDDGRTLWRIRRPDSHYTRWHDSAENCINDLASDSRARFLPLGGDMNKVMVAAHDAEGRYDAAKLGEDTRFLYNYFDRLSATAAGDMIRFWQEDATQAVPGARVETFRRNTSAANDVQHPFLQAHPDYPGAWQIDERGVRTPMGLMRGRFDAYWRNMLSSGWLSAEDAADFLMRRGVIDEARRKHIFRKGKVIVNSYRNNVTPAVFFSGGMKDRPRPYVDLTPLRGMLARHLSDYTTGYFMAHLNEMPLPDTAREWFGLAPFRFDIPLYDERAYRIKPGANNREQTIKWSHRRGAQLLEKELEWADRVRAAESGDNPLSQDPLFPMIQEAIFPAPSRSAEQGWAYSLGGPNALMHVRPESWNLLQEPVRGWSLLSNEARARLNEKLGGKPVEEGAEPPMPQALAELETVLREYPDLHRFELYPGDESRVVQLDVTEKKPGRYRRFDSLYDRPEHHGDNIIHGGFRLQEATDLPEYFRTDERVMPAMRTMATLRRAVHDSPYADAQGVWWNGERYGGKDGKKLVGMDDSWYTVEPMANIRRLFREMPEDGSPVMSFDKGITFGRRESLPEDAFLSTTVYRSPSYPLTQVRLMPGERDSCYIGTQRPYVTHSFIGAPMHKGYINRNWADLEFHFTPLEDFQGDVTREMIGHMAGWWGKRAVESSLVMLMDRTASPEALALSHHEDISNREVLMQLTEDSRFSASLEGRSPHELNAEEALAATWFHTLAEYETGEHPEQAAADLYRFHEYFTEHPERLEAVENMLNDHRTWYELDPDDKWYHVITATHEIREANRLRRERESEAWKARMKQWVKDDEEIDRIEFGNSIGKPKKPRRRK